MINISLFVSTHLLIYFYIIVIPMIDIDFEDISEWYGAMLEQKYREKFSVLKK